jgi:chitinase
MCDFVWVQFYNNHDCNIGAAGFNESFVAWSSDLAAANPSPRLYLGAPASSSGGTGYQDPDTFARTIEQVKMLNVSNFGGVMLWDGTEGHLTMDTQGRDFIDVTKDALLGN